MSISEKQLLANSNNAQKSHGRRGGTGPRTETSKKISSQNAVFRDRARSIPVGSLGRALLRYEWRLDRELYRTHRLLRNLQKIQPSKSPNPPKKDVKI